MTVTAEITGSQQTEETVSLRIVGIRRGNSPQYTKFDKKSSASKTVGGTKGAFGLGDSRASLADSSRIISFFEVKSRQAMTSMIDEECEVTSFDYAAGTRRSGVPKRSDLEGVRTG